MKFAVMRLVNLGILLCLLTQACANPSSEVETSPQQTLTLTGASTISPLATTMGKHFEAQNPQTRIDVHTGGSTRGVVDTQRGLADIGMVSRQLTQPEKADMQVFLIAVDGISLIVHSDNPITEISKTQIQDIYTDKVNNWQELGGPDAAITVVHKAEGHSTLDLFLNYIDLDNGVVQADVIIGDNQQGLKTIAGNPNAIGYVSIGSAEYDAQQGVPIKLLALDGITPSSENIANGTFPLLRELNLITKGTPMSLAQEFIDFTLAENNHELIKQQGFVPAKH
ncbi:phosphate ABC transporter substrate-binding protein [Leptolyngbya cf. ectocarpi LEGE 11479]|uniref:Phosphate ABC transporter substrate-binding protein n=1 Tax=Leptolyngbya cf. ectocarpi LEGE 11479 TaxID=1828722 RepID=A0A928ZW35_LEPEC|nr:phosphate ABC transporter substrate-binding protein [Leptolyngbya ectocarpi]MBE9068567.1 phosphate ABC transporter substrate-binding protein [Leptolyngbya cf. ectocarpi LEGE 11479]